MPSETYYAAYNVPYEDSFLVVGGANDVNFECDGNLLKYDVKNDTWIEINDQTILPCAAFPAVLVPDGIFTCS